LAVKAVRIRAVDFEHRTTQHDPKFDDAAPECGDNDPMDQDALASNTSEGECATVVFIDLAGFSAISDVYGDASAIAILEHFEGMVRLALEGYAPPVKWIGDEVMLWFPTPDLAVKALGKLLPACREEPRLPLTRTALHHGPVIRRAGDLFGNTVNIAARIAALAGPGQILATQPVAQAATAEGILVVDRGDTALRSLPDKVALYEIALSPTPDAAWIDPVCKMLAPYSAFPRINASDPWFCSSRCEEAYRRSPHTYGAPS
jgi:adenylate cyclase